MAADDGSHSKPLSHVLVTEFEAIRGRLQEDDTVVVSGADGATVPLHENIATQVADMPPDHPSFERRRLAGVYQSAHQLGLSALCLSGGGIRSAAISLGVIQALVDAKLLRQFDYLSTVSGGGYIGSWLSAWLHSTQNATQVIDRLGSHRHDPDRETPPLAHLRQYSNYLTPKVGLLSADLWTAVAIILRNLFVIWLILIPALAIPVVAVKLIATLLVEHNQDPRLAAAIGAASLVLGSLAFGYKLHRLYAAKASLNSQKAQARFLCLSVAPAVLGGFCFVWLVFRGKTVAEALNPYIPWVQFEPGLQQLKSVLAFAAVVFLGAIIVRFLLRPVQGDHKVAQPAGMGWKEYVAWAAGVLFFAVIVWFAASRPYLVGEAIKFSVNICTKSGGCASDSAPVVLSFAFNSSLPLVVLGMPVFLLATITAHSVYLLLRSNSITGDVEREWLGRASGWHFIVALSWIVVSAIVLFGPPLVYELLGQSSKWLMPLATAATGAATAFLGKSGSTPAKGTASRLPAIGATVALAVIGPIFAVLLLILIAVVVDWPLQGIAGQCFPTSGNGACGVVDWGKVIVGLGAILLFVDYFANVNRFSIHAIYRNRLVRAFLGGGRAPHRHRDGFTDFDWNDNFRVASLWPGQVRDENDWRPYHVLNATLNLAATGNLAWQERKASSFVITPKYCGNPRLGFRATHAYGGETGGITLGTAMAISGAAISSNMGYLSSPSLSFLLTLLNVRLGWWLGNPGQKGDRRPRLGKHKICRLDGPQLALRPFLSELFGLTSDESPYVYLSDGGHFEDLALYEMVRRRCRWIVVVDGDQDRDRGFADLGNAVRKIWIDLGVRIEFDKSPLLQALKDAKLDEIPYFAIGTITYVSDPPVAGAAPPTGYLLYIKPAVRGDEAAADVIAYKRSNDDFPDQSTADQWFDEPQLEAYRRLGHLMLETIVKVAPQPFDRNNPDLSRLISGARKIDQTRMAWP